MDYKKTKLSYPANVSIQTSPILHTTCNIGLPNWNLVNLWKHEEKNGDAQVLLYVASILLPMYCVKCLQPSPDTDCCSHLCATFMEFVPYCKDESTKCSNPKCVRKCETPQYDRDYCRVCAEKIISIYCDPGFRLRS